MLRRGDGGVWKSSMATEIRLILRQRPTIILLLSRHPKQNETILKIILTALFAWCMLGALPAALAQQAPASPCASACTGVLGENIYPNGDFGTGIPNVIANNPNLAPGYLYQPGPPPNDGYYTITNSTFNWGWFAQNYWIDIEDNGPEPNGYFMVVNASYPPGLFFQNSVAVCENTMYEFSVDVINIFFSQFATAIKPNLSFLIDDIVYCTTGDIPADQAWHTMRFSFTTAPGQTSVKLAMQNNAPGGYGNDLALDNISFRTCGPELATSDTVGFCSGQSVLLEAQLLNNVFAQPEYQWQIFSNGTWESIPDADSIVLIVADPQDGNLFRLLTASSQNNIQELHCRAVSSDIRLVEQPSLQLQTAVSDVTCFGQQNGIAQVQSLNGLAPFTYQWNSNSSGNALNGLAPGDYALVVTDAWGCTGAAAVTVAEPAPLVSILTMQPVNCFGESTGEVFATATGGTAPYTFAWSSSASGDTLTGLSAGDYLLTLTDARGCSFSNQATITTPPPLSFESDIQAVSCFGVTDGSASLVVSGGSPPFAFLWNTGTADSAIHTLMAGVYSCTATDVQGCTLTASFDISEPPALSLTATAGDVACFNGQEGSTQAMATGGTAPFVFLWNDGQTTAQITGLPAATYTVTVTDANACTSVAESIIASPPPLQTQVAAVDELCFEQTEGQAIATVSGGVAPYQFLWNTGQTTSGLNGLPAGAYWVVITDANGCNSTASASIQQPELFSLTAFATEVRCFGGNDAVAGTTVSGGTFPYTIQWSAGQAGAQVDGLAAGPYSVTAIDAHGCSATQVLTVVQPPALVSIHGAAAVTCFGANDGATWVEVSGGQTPYQYLWSNGAEVSQPGNLPAGSYAVTVTDARSCTLTASLQVDQPPALLAQIDAIPANCAGQSDGSANAFVTGGTAPYTILWSNQQNAPAINGLPAGSYTLTAVDAQGCSLSASTTINEPPPLVGLTQVQDVACFGDDSGTATIALSGGTAPYIHYWQNGHSGNSLQQLPAGAYSVTATDAHGCTISASMTVQQPPALHSEIEAQDAACFGLAEGTASVTATGGVPPYTFSWQTGESTPQINHLLSGWYTVDISDVHLCRTSNQVWIGQPTPLGLNTHGKPLSCPEVTDGMVSANAEGGIGPYTFVWNTQQTGATLQHLTPGTYTVTVTDGHGCTLASTQTVGELPGPSVNLGLDQIVVLGEELLLIAQTNLPGYAVAEYDWRGDAGEQTCDDCYSLQFVPLAGGCERVRVRDIHGCEAEDEICYQVRRERHIYVPNVFTPNDDGENDFFTIYSDASVKEIRYLSVYDRWGEHLFIASGIPTNNDPLGWDGIFQGHPLNPGVFVWVAEVEFIDGEVILLKGDVTLLR
jgi:gliding motility-associated-like protein